MERVTRRAGPDTVIYIGGHHQHTSGDIPAEINTAGIRDILKRLADYEDTGLTPQEIAALMNPAAQKMTDAIVEAIPQLVQFIVENAPKLVEAQAATLIDIPTVNQNMQSFVTPKTVAALHRMGEKVHGGK